MVAASKKQLLFTNENLLAAFQYFDVDRDGRITSRDISNLFEIPLKDLPFSVLGKSYQELLQSEAADQRKFEQEKQQKQGLQKEQQSMDLDESERVKQVSAVELQWKETYKVDLLSHQLETKGREKPAIDALDKDKIFGISFTVFCKTMLKLMEKQDEEELEEQEN